MPQTVHVDVDLEDLLAKAHKENAHLRKERDRLLQENADLQLAQTGLTLGSHGECIAVALPIAPLGSQYIPQHLDVRLDAAQAAVLARITHGLDRGFACLKTGSRCRHNPDTIRWLLEQVAERVESRGSRVESRE